MGADTRKMYVFDVKVINEQACRDDAVKHVRNDNARRVEIHKHKVDAACANNVIDVKDAKHLQTLSPEQCYAFTKETDVGNWVSHNTPKG